MMLRPVWRLRHSCKVVFRSVKTGAEPALVPPLSTLKTEREYLEKISQSSIMTSNKASPTAVHERDLRYEELLAKALRIPPRSPNAVATSDAMTVFRSFQSHGCVNAWAYNGIIRYDIVHSGGMLKALLENMKADGVRPDVHTHNLILSSDDEDLLKVYDIDCIPNRTTFIIRLRRYGKTKDVEKAMATFIELLERGIVLDDEDEVFQLMSKCARTRDDLGNMQNIAKQYGYSNFKWEAKS